MADESSERRHSCSRGPALGLSRPVLLHRMVSLQLRPISSSTDVDPDQFGQLRCRNHNRSEGGYRWHIDPALFSYYPFLPAVVQNVLSKILLRLRRQKEHLRLASKESTSGVLSSHKLHRRFLPWEVTNNITEVGRPVAVELYWSTKTVDGTCTSMRANLQKNRYARFGSTNM